MPAWLAWICATEWIKFAFVAVNRMFNKLSATFGPAKKFRERFMTFPLPKNHAAMSCDHPRGFLGRGCGFVDQVFDSGDDVFTFMDRASVSIYQVRVSVDRVFNSVNDVSRCVDHVFAFGDDVFVSIYHDFNFANDVSGFADGVFAFVEDVCGLVFEGKGFESTGTRPLGRFNPRQLKYRRVQSIMASATRYRRCPSRHR
jgi:hypothetical protein